MVSVLPDGTPGRQKFALELVAPARPVFATPLVRTVPPRAQVGAVPE
jgi:hypothetical protein